MAQQEKAPAAKPDNLGLIPRPHKKRTNKERQTGACPLLTYASTQPTQNKINGNINKVEND